MGNTTPQTELLDETMEEKMELDLVPPNVFEKTPWEHLPVQPPPSLHYQFPTYPRHVREFEPIVPTPVFTKR